MFSVAPTRVSMLGRQGNDVIEVNEGGEVTLECMVENSKPPAIVKWYKHDKEINLGKFVY